MENENQKLKQSFKDYYHSNEEFRNKFKQRQNEKIECECGAIVCRGGMNKHIKTPKHINKFAVVETKLEKIINERVQNKLKDLRKETNKMA